MNTGDANYIKKLNRTILIEEIIKNVSISRSELARITGLNKATVSAQISDLMDEHLVIEKRQGESINRGRKPIILQINKDAGYSIGVDIDEDNINIILTNMTGIPFERIKIPVDHLDLYQLTDYLIDQLNPIINKYNDAYRPLGLVGVGVGIHGIVNDQDEVIFTPKRNWSNITISQKLKEAFNTNVTIDNNANLCVFAEQVYVDHISDLFCVTLYSGIGLGMLSENEIYRGYEGFAGEIGHMIIESNGLSCSCGNKGCWELYASEKALLNKLAIHFPSYSFPNDLEKIIEDKLFIEILDPYLDYLAIGLNNIINIFNPEKIIINGSIVNQNLHFIDKVTTKLHSKINSYQEIKGSYIGADACALGGAAYVLKEFLDVNMVNYAGYNYF